LLAGGLQAKTVSEPRSPTWKETNLRGPPPLPFGSSKKLCNFTQEYDMKPGL